MIKSFKHFTKQMTVEQHREFIGCCLQKAFEILERNYQGVRDYSKDKSLRTLIFEKAHEMMTTCRTSLGSDVYPLGADVYDEIVDIAASSENKGALEELNKLDRTYFAFEWDKLYHSSNYDFYDIAKKIIEYYQL